MAGVHLEIGRKLLSALAGTEYIVDGSHGIQRSDLTPALVCSFSPSHYFLANGGIDAAELSETINSVNIPNTFEPLQPIYDTDVDVSRKSDTWRYLSGKFLPALGLSLPELFTT